MKKILLILLLLMLLGSCSSRSDDDSYIIISQNKVDGYDIYEYEHNGLFCNTLYQDVYYSDADYNYGFTFKGCSPGITFFIKYNGQYIYIEEALDQGLITMESLLPELSQLERETEELPEEADYMWLDFWIMGDVVYAYCGGECDQEGSEQFMINGQLYEYTTSGCLQDYILFMQINREYVPIANLIDRGDIDGEYLIPLLNEVS